MKSKERVLLTINHREPDRVPLYAEFTPPVEKVLTASLGVSSRQLGPALGNDIVRAPTVGIVGSFYGGRGTAGVGDGRIQDWKEGDTYTDEWGITFKWVRQPTGYYTEIVGHPLADATLSDLDGYPWPDLLQESYFDELDSLLNEFGSEYAIIGGQVSIFESAWFLRGLERFMADMIENAEFANRLLDILLELHLPAVLKMVDMGVDIAWSGDDFGLQTGMMISPGQWREFFKPRYQYAYSRIKKVNPEIKIAYHSCGNIMPIIPDLIEIGLDILNPIQPRSIDPVRIKSQFGDKLTLFGSLDVQWTLPFGTAVDIEREVKERINTLGLGGGFILSPAHAVQSDTSIDNILAFYNAAKKYGPYSMFKPAH